MPSRTLRRSRSRINPAAEQLEQRLALAIDVGGTASEGIAEISWQGHSVDAFVDRWILDFDEAAAGQSLDSLVTTAGSDGWSVSGLGVGLYSLRTPSAGVAEIVSWAESTPGITSIEPDFALGSALLPNDSAYGQLWGLSNLGQSGGVVDVDIDAPEAWRVTTGSRTVVIAVIDSGVDVNHPDLAGNIWQNPGEIPGNGIDDDGNGFVDDVSGWDFVSNDNRPQDDNGHGTHVAGILGAVGNNAAGIAGVNWQVSILPLKFLDDSGSGSTADAIAAMNYVATLRGQGVNIVAANNSWGGGGFSSAMRSAISRLGDLDVTFVAAAGNEGTNSDATPAYPASYDLPNVISVAAIDRQGRLAGFSNYGQTAVDLAAPGVSIYSTTPGNSYATYSGTSMAAPYVSGVVGLLAAAAPSATAADIRTAILETVAPMAELGGRMVTGGLLNAAAAVGRLAEAPVAGPVVLSVSPGGVVETAVQTIQVVFDQEILAASLRPENFHVVHAGADGLLDTVDDSSIVVPAAGISQSPAGTVSLSPTEPLRDGVYRLRLVGTGSDPLRSLSGEPLLGGSDALFSFRVTIPVVTPAPAAPFEPNDTLLTAAVGLDGASDDVTLRAAIGDGVNAGRDVDIFSIEVGAGDLVEVAIRAESIGSSLDSYLRLFDSTGRQLAANDDFNGSLDSGLTFTFPDAGSYYVGVSGYGNARYTPTTGTDLASGSAGDYQLVLRRTVPVPLVPIEKDDTIATARSVVLLDGAAASEGLIGDGEFGDRDVDLFALPLAEGDTLTIDISARDLGSSLDSYLRLFDAAGNEVASNDDARGSLDSYLEFTAPARGSYYVGVSGFRNSRYSPLVAGSGARGSTGRYEIAFGVASRPAPVLPEPNDTLATATVGLGTTDDAALLTGFVGDGWANQADVDIFSVVLAAGDRLDAAVLARVNRSTLDSYLRVFDAAGTEVAFNDDAGSTTDSRLSFTAMVDGIHYVGVSGFGNSRYAPIDGSGTRNSNFSGAYQLDLRRVTPPLEPNDRLADATPVVLQSGAATFSGAIGDGVHGTRDVDLFALTLVVGQIVTLDVNAWDTGSNLDSYLRIFDSSGRELAANDDSAGSRDSFLRFAAPASDTFYVGLSGYGNGRYSALTAGSGRAGSTGEYQLGVTITPAPASVSLFAAVARSAASPAQGPSAPSLFQSIALLAASDKHDPRD